MDTIQIAKSFEFFCKKIYKKEYTFQYSETSFKVAEKFLSILDKKYKGSLGIDYLLRYSIFQYNYWKDLALTQYNKKINFPLFWTAYKFLRRPLDAHLDPGPP